MTHDDVIRLARKVADPDTVDPLCGGDQRDLITLNLDEMVRFAALVAAHEREACARLCDAKVKDEYATGLIDHHEIGWTESCAFAIRARGDEPKRHPGYIIGDHWLQAAYTRVCTGEDIRQVMEDYGYYP